ncbi:uncharacterized protein RCC_07676 [Ramularia collo-cygni]|uniref:Conserved oligomeric Golgi complex subunit 2 n=1 Tax=Ramularia collo-cygni TaxID=112498 RepID=A0A2D3VIH0_9PEZI|nr:uncharacterized protein RCC_07676 [Ramularia collo-cygni]CZT21809.1 uncharacterized protein RCC_07676 [Ramularia collo-cygni]
MTTFTLDSASPSISAASTPAYRYSSSDEEDDDISTLPYPAELSRTAFLAPDFSPGTYLSTLRNRHQTLEDLRADLRQRSQLLNRELLDLVNGNYEEFLSLGVDLRGGEEKVEGVRVGVLGFEREVRAVKASVQERAGEARELVRERKEVRRDVMFGRALLDVGEKVEDLERALRVGQGGEDSFEDEEDEEEDEEDEDADETSPGIPLNRLRRHADSYLLISRMIEKLEPDHPFLVAQRAKLLDLKKTLLLDLAAALRSAKQSKSEAVLGLVRIYSDLDAQAESCRVLKGP